MPTEGNTNPNRRLACFTVYNCSLPTPTGVGVGVVFTSVCLCVCLYFPYDISKTDAATITKLDKEMFQHESWEPIYFGIRMSKVKVKASFALIQFCPRGS